VQLPRSSYIGPIGASVLAALSFFSTAGNSREKGSVELEPDRVCPSDELMVCVAEEEERAQFKIISKSSSREDVHSQW
jgi:hypothetical protein